MPESPSGNELTSLRVDLAEPVVHHRLQAGVVVVAVRTLACDGAVERTTEVEVRQPRRAGGLAVGDAVEVFFHLGGEVVVDEVAEMALEQLDHGEREERRARARCPS